MGLLWPGMMGRYGQVIGLPFAMEGIAFFIEAIFLGHLPLRLGSATAAPHLLSGIPIVVAGVCSAFFVVTANAWMNQPARIHLAQRHASSRSTRGRRCSTRPPRRRPPT